MSIALNSDIYTFENALTWGYFGEHCKKAFIEEGISLGNRFTHGLIALLEFLPVISQIVSIFEKCIFDACHLSSQESQEKSVEESNNVLSTVEIKPKSKINLNSPVKTLKLDFFIHCILSSFFSIKDIGILAQTDHFFSSLLNDNDLWKSIAMNQKIQLDGTETHPREQIKNSVDWIVADLAFEKHSTDTMFVYKTQKEIEEEGGICLIPNRNTFGADGDYHGIIVHKEEGKYFLHLCPGGGYCSFEVEDFEEFMPAVINKLNELKIIPNQLSRNIGRHPGNTLDNFIAWQKKHRNSFLGW